MPAERDCNGCEFRKAIPFSRVTLHGDRLGEPLGWRKRYVVGVCFMGDLWHEQVHTHFICEVFSVINKTPEHTYLILTKRPERQRDFFQWYGTYPARGNTRAWSNVWLGVTVCNQPEADRDIAILLETPAAYRFVSYEPALEAIDFRNGCGGWEDWLFQDPGLDLIIAGCESGPGRRPAPHDWFRSVTDQCKDAGVPLYLKQMSENEDGTGKVVKLPDLDGKQHLDLPWRIQ